MATDIVERNGESAEKVGLTPVTHGDWINRVHFGDCRESLRAMAAAGIKVQTCVTSPPYFGLRDYDVDGQIGLEETPEQFISELVDVFRCVRDVLTDDGTLWVNIGDSYNNNPSTSLIPRAEQGMGSGVFCLPSETQVQARRAKPNKAQPLIDAGIKKKDLIGIPWMLAFALRADGWYLRQDIIWHKPNPMPESVTDRCTKAHEYLFLLSKAPRYFMVSDGLREPVQSNKGNANGFRGGAYVNNATFNNAEGGKRTLVGNTRSARDSFKREGSKREVPIVGQTAGTHRPDRAESEYDIDTRNRRSVWTIATRPYSGAHFATFPPDLIEPCILAGSRPGDAVLDCFMGSGTTAAVSIQHGRQFIGCELNADYKPLQDDRIAEAHAAIAEAQAAADLAARQIDLFAEAP